MACTTGHPHARWRACLHGGVAGALLLAATGCPPRTPPTPQAPARSEPSLVTNNPLHPRPAPADAPDPVRLLIHMEVYEILVPYGALSGSADFWKRLDEQVVDVGTFDILWRNGVRVGSAPASEWPYFKQIIDQNPARADKRIHIAREARNIELPMRAETVHQNLFVFDANNRMKGRSFERSVNLWQLSFEPTPRQVGSVRVSLCPVVRSVRRHLEFVGDREGRTIEYVAPEHVYDLNLVVDIPMEGFLVVAPSPEAQLKTSVGRNFLVVEGEPERLERLLLFVPKPYTLEASGPQARGREGTR